MAEASAAQLTQLAGHLPACPGFTSWRIPAEVAKYRVGPAPEPVGDRKIAGPQKTCVISYHCLAVYYTHVHSTFSISVFQYQRFYAYRGSQVGSHVSFVVGA